jgi:ATP-dependent Clp protease ATP-binding subunit ClpA
MLRTLRSNDAMKLLHTTQVRAYLKPELINRLDDIIIFKPLTRENLHQITRLLVRKVCA